MTDIRYRTGIRVVHQTRKATTTPWAECPSRACVLSLPGLAVCASLHYEVMLGSDRVTGGNTHADVDETPRRASPASIVLAHDGCPQPNPNPHVATRSPGRDDDRRRVPLCDGERVAGRPGAGIRRRSSRWAASRQLIMLVSAAP